MFYFLESYEEPILVTIQLLKQFKIDIHNDLVSEKIYSHPDYPSILSISDTLKDWNIYNEVIQIEPDRLSELPVPFIAYLKYEKDKFILITDAGGEEIKYLTKNNKIKKKDKADFINKFGGIVLLAFPKENSIAKIPASKVTNSRKLQLNLVFFFLAVICGLAIVNTFSIGISVAYIFLKLAGILITSLLLAYEADKANPLLKRICSAGKKVNCSAILNSKSAKIFSWLTWSEIGFYYFAGGFISLILSAVTQKFYIVSIIEFLSLFALPFILLSIYYQWKIIRQWCLLCLAVQGILLTEFILSIAFTRLHFSQFFENVDLGIISIIFIAYIIPILLWTIVKPLLYSEKKYKEDFKSLQRFKFNDDIFITLLGKQKIIDNPPGTMGVILGNPSAPNTLIKVCNPFCEPCAQAHLYVDELLKTNDNLKIQIIFTAANDTEDERFFPVRHFLSLKELNDVDLIEAALNDWYSAKEKNYQVFKKKYNVDLEGEKQRQEIEDMDSWCKMENISFTPTFFFNNHQLPDLYQVKDLKYFLR